MKFEICGRRIEHERNYGIDRKSGWFVTVDDCVIAQFVGFWQAVCLWVTYRPESE